MSKFNMQGMGGDKRCLTAKELNMQYVFDVQGMTCGHCERAVTQAVQSVDAEAKVQIDRGANRVEVESQASREALSAAIAEEGYKVA